MRNAVNAADRQREDHRRRRSPHVGHRPARHHGVVVRLFPDEDLGVPKTAEGGEVCLGRGRMPRDGGERLDLDGAPEFGPMAGKTAPFAANLSLRHRAQAAFRPAGRAARFGSAQGARAP